MKKSHVNVFSNVVVPQSQLSAHHTNYI